MIDITK